MSVKVFVGVGGNVGDVAMTIKAALLALNAMPGTTLLRVSSLYRTAPFGDVEQADFLNAVAEFSTRSKAAAFLDALLAIERLYGRNRSLEQRWGPRTLDLDLLTYGDAIITMDGLKVPHPGIPERLFVLRPWAELAADFRIPGMGQVGELLALLESREAAARLPEKITGTPVTLG